ncbi:hypothetical protein Pmani_013720 [Petrolisthes manimaculis]|uniref:Uncharacterized protein n=1 Tax=Petrolisthes manimaculis TaxID=1843537 RepID=A0AAE1PWY6_9EUCA|nr:hypothetical protein Pmani_013720 [Petrolisthes manimaculis]
MVERFKDGFGYYYKIYGYALGNEEDYKLIPVTTQCECRRWCQVSTKCHSVSVVKVAGVGVECRVSNRPVHLTDINDRPRLNKTHQAMHFLSAEKSSSWEELGQTGVKFRTSEEPQYWSYCNSNCRALKECMGSCTYAILNTWALLEDALTLLQAHTSYNINLYRNELGNAEIWGPGWGGTPEIKYSDSEINTTTLHDTHSDKAKSRYTITLDGHYTFSFNGKIPNLNLCLCMDNPLNLEEL